MSEPTDHNDLPEDALLAAEYALGVLDGAARAAASARLTHDRAFALLVAEWEERLTPWAGEIADVAPAPQIWDRIAASLPAPAAPRTGLWQSLAFWRGLTMAAGALAAASLAALIYIGTVAPKEPLVASIEGGGHRHFVATIDPRRGQIAVVPAAFAADASRVPELWVIPPDGRPRSLGLLRADRGVTLTLPSDLAAFATSNAVLAVSLEPPGGSPTGAPTGPVIATGKLTNL